MGTKIFSNVSRGVGLSVLVLLVIAVVAGQARANLPRDASRWDDFGRVAVAGALVTDHALRQLRRGKNNNQ